MFNPCANHPDVAVRQAFESVFRALQGPKLFTNFRVEEIKDQTTGNPVLLIRVLLAGKLTTVAAVDNAGKIWSKDSNLTVTDFNTMGWNRSE